MFNSGIFPRLISFFSLDTIRKMMTHHPNAVNPPQPLGTLLGVTDGGCHVFSCDYDQMDKSMWKNMSWFENYIDDNYTGFKWQCVELARRYWLLNYGIVFDSIPMAYDIFRLEGARRVKDNETFKMIGHRNGSKVWPVKGSLLIWNPVGEFRRTGHVAVVVNVQDTFVDIVEQNVEDSIWPAGVNYSRRLRAEVGSDNGYRIHCSYSDAVILGWKTIDFEKPFDYTHYPNCREVDIKRVLHKVDGVDPNDSKWLDKSKDYVKVFFDKYGHNLVGKGETQAPYYTVTASGEVALKHATNVLHELFLDATDYVLHHKAQLADKFCIPERIWPRLRLSWFRQRNDIISGRFDFSVTPSGIKVYEYNADSASCLLECGLIQESWSKAVGLEVGKNTSSSLFKNLVDTWKQKNVDGHLHLLCDNDLEEIYHSMYMKSAAEEAGIKCTLIVGFKSISWAADGNLLDSNGVEIINIWKTWSWRTALNQITEKQMDLYFPITENFRESKEFDTSKIDRSQAPNLPDLVFHPRVRVFEPLWTLIPSCKSILPVLWNLKHDHPYFLRSSFECDATLEKSGYASKPVTGRAGGNIALYNPDGSLIEQTAGKWEDDKYVFQELCMLPKFDEDFVQVCTWAINGEYSGTVLRVDKTGIINLESNVYPIRVIPDA
jgi:glutathionylspermidine amidase/synthetase